VVAMQAAALARKEGEARLAELKKAPQTTLAGEPQVVSRAQTKDLPRGVLDAILRADASALPAFAGVSLGDQGYAVVRVNKVLGRDPVAADATRAQAQFTQAYGEAETQAYYAALKRRFKAEIKEGVAAADSSASAASQ
ncbi:MAG TPA: peptidyl-prolyl cis-trans isomerase, partial [Albitalea sp.]|nr:peptidyl-prolyl cis-trans isomerase [Albitalea sp.]